MIVFVRIEYNIIGKSQSQHHLMSESCGSTYGKHASVSYNNNYSEVECSLREKNFGVDSGRGRELGKSSKPTAMRSTQIIWQTDRNHYPLVQYAFGLSPVRRIFDNIVKCSSIKMIGICS